MSHSQQDSDGLNQTNMPGFCLTDGPDSAVDWRSRVMKLKAYTMLWSMTNQLAPEEAIRTLRDNFSNLDFFEPLGPAREGIQLRYYNQCTQSSATVCQNLLRQLQEPTTSEKVPFLVKALKVGIERLEEDPELGFAMMGPGPVIPNPIPRSVACTVAAPTQARLPAGRSDFSFGPVERCVWQSFDGVPDSLPTSSSQGSQRIYIRQPGESGPGTAISWNQSQLDSYASLRSTNTARSLHRAAASGTQSPSVPSQRKPE